jgi:hypothetical protein
LPDAAEGKQGKPKLIGLVSGKKGPEKTTIVLPIAQVLADLEVELVPPG